MQNIYSNIVSKWINKFSCAQIVFCISRVIYVDIWYLYSNLVNIFNFSTTHLFIAINVMTRNVSAMPCPSRSPFFCYSKINQRYLENNHKKPRVSHYLNQKTLPAEEKILFDKKLIYVELLGISIIYLTLKRSICKSMISFLFTGRLQIRH